MTDAFGTPCRARYLDPRLRRLRPDAPLDLPRLRIGTADVAVSVVTRRGRIAAIEIAVQQAGASAAKLP